MTYYLDKTVHRFLKQLDLLCSLLDDAVLLSLRSFFFQAEDGIRDKLVTGVQTCALPIWRRCGAPARIRAASAAPGAPPRSRRATRSAVCAAREIGRAAGRERG